MRRAHFKVDGRDFNGARSARITIVESSGHQLFSVRPYKRRKCYELELSEVAAGVIYQCVKKEIAEKRALKKKRLPS